MAGGYGDRGSRNHIKKFPSLRTAALWAGILGLFQSLIWIGLTIMGILAYTCNMPINPIFSFGSVIQYAFYTLYFKGDCIPADYQQFDTTIIKSVETILTPEDVLIWDCVYLGVAACWFITSLLLLIFVRKDNVKSSGHVISAWLVTIFCINLMDLGLGIIFGIDYSKFNLAAYNYNLSTINAGEVNAQAAQLVAAAVAAVSLMIISLKGFVLWLINFGLMCYLLALVMPMVSDRDSNDTLFMPRKASDDTLNDRPPINAYEEQSITTKVYANDAFVPDSPSIVTVELNEEALARAARMSTDITEMGARFRNIDSFQQYPPPRFNNNNNNNNTANNNNFIKQVSIRENGISTSPTTPGVMSPFPAPDYTPPMSRSNNVAMRNDAGRYQ
ncbi:uncharacterized protein LOC118747031 [Rhagoletis pomonella]|uniref:uncharacterized protein LOC118747031 n=1 Tax=Rhagoletis pomonella TaxID=28610 RepID=UPI00177E2773|nr:uncharacterized protein LOC118747031 [Rhagoletis pomonella]